MRVVWRGPQGMAALAVIMVMVVWRSVLLDGSFFNQDDFYLLARAYQADLDWDFLLADTAGHLMPAQQLGFWLVAHRAPYVWGLVAAGVLVTQLLSAVACWHVLTRILPDRWIRVLLLAVLCWAPMTLVPTLWWAAAMGLWPNVLCSFLAVLFLLRAMQGAGPRWRELTMCVLSLLVGLLWWERAVLIAPVVFAVAFLMADCDRFWSRLWVTVAGWWTLWATFAVVLIGYLILHGRLADVEGGGGSPGTTLEVTWAYVAENVLPGLMGGPWAAEINGGAVQPAFWVTTSALILAVSLSVLLVTRGGPVAPWAIAFLLIYILVDAAMLLMGRGSFGRLIGLDPRYSADVIHVGVLAAALALRGAPEHYGLTLPGKRAWVWVRTGAIGGTLGLYLCGATLGTSVLVPHFQNTADRTYFTNLRAGLAAESDQVLFDSLVPNEVVLPLVGEDSQLSRVLAPLPERPAFDEPSPSLRVVQQDGKLARPEFAGIVDAFPGQAQGCGYAVTDEWRTLALRSPVSGRLLMRLGYFTATEATVDLSLGSWSTQFQVRPGPNEMWVVVPDLGEEWSRYWIRLDGSSTVCVTDIQVGLPRPS